MAALGVPKKGPHQKIKWLKGLTGDLDDDDSSDTSQPPTEKRERVKKPQKKPQKSKEMAEKKSRATQQEASGSDKDKRRPKKKLRRQDADESEENTAIARAAHKIGEKRRLVCRGSDSGKHASKDRSAQSVGSADEGSDENRQRRRLRKEAML
ncbi:hypothetical protein BBJ29_009255 [Phytophthora kernoviae]|uniref:Uncharacterized protein n=1 Tax=Phytophthora kernoviae TaxID=325452 RepID=A0A3F2RC31_9STRA|nr:hypothetical protein BBJ29_009255 [Phytophthora kernoviae]RLN52411.1 hypothetical protein BBP00_00009622 [Phytophthora kernoviae]